MASLFISYSRRNIESARTLTEAFKGQDLDFWIDWEGIPPTVDWWKEIENGIEGADIFLFLISPDSCQSKVCKQEIQHAIKNGKRLIPLVVQEVKGDEAPPELGHLNWIFFREGDDFELAFQKLITAIKTDYVWAQAHRELQVKALEWEKSGHENSFLLFGKELEDAEHQLATNTSKDPHPTDLQREYVHLSRKAVDRRRARNAILTTVALITLAALAVFGFIQANAANTNASKAKQQTSFALSALALSEKDKDLELSLLLGKAAFDTEQNPRTRSTIVALGNTNPQLAAYLPVGKPSEAIMVFSPDHKVFVSAEDKTFSLWDASSPTDAYTLLTSVVSDSPVSSMAIGQNNTLLALGSVDSPIGLWDLSDTGHPKKIGSLSDSGYIFDFLNNGSVLISEDSFGTLAAWDVQNPKLPRKLSTIQESVDVLRVRGDLLITRNSDSKITIWNMVDPAHPRQMGVLPNPIGSYDVNADGDLLIETNGDAVILWDISDPTNPSQISQLTNLKDVLDIRVSKDMLAVASCAELIKVGTNIDPWVQQSGERYSCVESVITLWNITDPTQPTDPFTLTGQNGYVLQLLFEPGGARLLSKGENSVILWNVTNPTSPFELSRRSIDDTSSGVTSIAFSPDDTLLAVGSNQIILQSIENPHQTTHPVILDDSGQWVTGLAFSQDGNSLFASYNDRISGWDVHTGKGIDVRCEIPEGTVITSMAVGRYKKNDILAIGDVQGGISFCNLSSSAALDLPTFLLGHQERISSLAFLNEDKTLLASGSEDGAIVLWNLAANTVSSTVRETGNAAVTGIAIEPGTQILSARTQDNTIFLWDIHNPAKPKMLSSFSADQDSINQDREKLAVNENNIIASGGFEDNIMIWDASNPLDPFLLATLAGNNDRSNNEEVAFSHKGTILATGYSNGTVILWDVDPSSWIERMCQRAGRNFTHLEWERYFSNEPYRKTCEQWPLEPEVTATPSPMP